jgi:hypothetical protein
VAIHGPRGAGHEAAVTDDQGNYTIDGLCAGSLGVSAGLRDVGHGFYDADADGRPDLVDITADAPDATGIDIVLTLTPPPAACTDGQGSISGTVSDTDGNPVEGAHVTAIGRGAHGVTLTDANGTYSISGLCEGLYKVSAGLRGAGQSGYDADGDHRPDPVALTADAMDATGVDMTLRLARPRRP